MDGESQNERDARVEKLWRSLHGKKNDGDIDLDGLRDGLRRIDHPLQHADTMLRSVMKAVDTSGDGRIQYIEFRDFVERTEQELWQMFKSIDYDHNGALDKQELRLAFERSDIKISEAKLQDFFDRVDRNHDGIITFDEWRDFLLFIPTLTPNLRSVLSFYTSTVQVSPEGDASVQDENFEGLGYFIAGGLAGAVSRTATAPLDRLKVFLIAQTGSKVDTVNAVKSGNVLYALRAAVKPLGDACVELWKVGGIRSLWAGNGLNVVKVAPESAIKFGSYEGAKRVMARFEGHGDPREISGMSQFFAAGTGGMISQFAVYPLDTLKFRVQCETVEGGSKGNALIVAVFQRMRAEGVATFYRGLGMGLIGMFPYAALDLTIYEHLKRVLIARKMARTGCREEDALPGQMVTGGIGAVSSSLGASAVYPLNLLRTRMQSQGTAIHPPTYDGWRDCFAKTMQQEGFRGLYKGLTPNLLKVVPAMSISYIMYESSKTLMGLR